MLSPARLRHGMLALLAFAGPGCRPAEAELTVFAAASLREVCAELGAAFEGQNQARAIFSFAGSNLLARQLVDGAPCDVFLSAGAPPMDEVERAGLLEPGSRFDLVGNALVVVQPWPLPADLEELRSARDLLDERLGPLALANPEAVPAGRYARAWLESLGLWEQLAPRVVPAIDVRAALALVEAGVAGAGVVYATDVKASAAARVVLRVPAEETPQIVYPAAALARGRAPHLARAFLEFLRTEAAGAVLERHGFRRLAGG